MRKPKESFVDRFTRDAMRILLILGIPGTLYGLVACMDTGGWLPPSLTKALGIGGSPSLLLAMPMYLICSVAVALVVGTFWVFIDHQFIVLKPKKRARI